MNNSNKVLRAGLRSAAVCLLAVFLLPVTTFAQDEFVGVYLGSFDDLDDDFGEFGVAVFDDGTATMALYDSFDFTGFAAENFTVNADGSFAAQDVDPSGTDISGLFVGSSVMVTVMWGDGTSVDVTGTASAENGFFTPSAGYYNGPIAGDIILDGTPIGDFAGTVHTISDAQGNSFTYTSTILDTEFGPEALDFGGFFSIGTDGSISANLLDGELFTGSFDFALKSASGMLGFNEQGVALNSDWSYDLVQLVFENRSFAPNLIGLGDVNGADGSSDIAILFPDAGTADIDLIIKDGETGADINGGQGGQAKAGGEFPQKVSLGMVIPVGMASVPDVSGNGIEEVAVLVVNLDSTNSVRMYDASDGSLLRNMSFAPAFAPVAMGVIPDIDGQGTPAIAVLGVNANGDVRVQIKSAADGSQIRNVQFAPNFPPKYMAIVPDVSGNDIAELAVLGIDANGNIRVQLKDSGDGSLIHWIQYAAAFAPRAMVVIPDSDGGTAPAIAVLGEHIDGRISAQVKDALTRQPVNAGRVNFGRTFEFHSMVVVGDLDDNNISELVYFGVDGSGNVRAQIKDSVTKAAIQNVAFAKTFTPHAIARFADMDGNTRDELGVLGTNPNNGNSRVQIKDALTRNEVSVVPVP